MEWDLRHDLDKYYKNKKNNLEEVKIDKKPLSNYLRIDYTNKKYFEEALECQPNDTISRRRIWLDNPQIVVENNKIVLEQVPTLTTKQDRHPNSGNLYFDPQNGKSKFRYLTPRECFLLMGFEEVDFDILLENNIISRANGRFFSQR